MGDIIDYVSSEGQRVFPPKVGLMRKQCRRVNLGMRKRLGHRLESQLFGDTLGTLYANEWEILSRLTLTGVMLRKEAGIVFRTWLLFSSRYRHVFTYFNMRGLTSI